MKIFPQPPDTCDHSNATGTPQHPKTPGGPLRARAFPLHFARVRFPAAVDLPEAAAADDSVNAEVVHGELEGWGGEWDEPGHQALPQFSQVRDTEARWKQIPSLGGEGQGFLLTWMFSSTFFHWQNRVNLSLQGRAERARVEIPEKHGLQRLPGFVSRQGAPPRTLGKGRDPQVPSVGIPGRSLGWETMGWDTPICMGISSQLTSQ